MTHCEVQWNLSPGMGFNDTRQWWGEGGLREVAHNGIDLREYLYNDGNSYIVDVNTRIPAAEDGEIFCIIKDFLGQSVFVRHREGINGRIIMSAYGHMDPDAGLAKGLYIVGGAVLGRVAGQGDNKKIPAHLHYSLLEIDSTIDPGAISWPMLEQADGVTFIDPNDDMQ